MIPVKKLSKPTKLDNVQTAAKIEAIKKAVRKKVRAKEKLNSELDFPNLWTAIKEDLFELNHKKCAYCETIHRAKRLLDVEHFRPKAGIKGELHTGYWWLAYDTDNMFLACKVCNSDHKGTQFPLKNKKRAKNERSNLAHEQPMLIDPSVEDPSNFIGYVYKNGTYPVVIAVGIDADDRGYNTIKICGLRDDDLNASRAENINLLESLKIRMICARENGNQVIIDELANQIKAATQANKQYAGARRWYFQDAGLGMYVAND